MAAQLLIWLLKIMSFSALVKTNCSGVSRRNRRFSSAPLGARRRRRRVNSVCDPHFKVQNITIFPRSNEPIDT